MPPEVALTDVVGPGHLADQYWGYQGQQNYCVLYSAASILGEVYGQPIDMDAMVARADENGWLVRDENGVALGIYGENFDDLLASYGVPSHNLTGEQGAWESLNSALTSNQRVIVSVDSGELDLGGDDGTENDADHAIAVTGIDYGRGVVIVNDSARSAGLEIPLDVFYDAWRDSNFEITITDTSLPPIEGAVPPEGATGFDPDAPGFAMLPFTLHLPSAAPTAAGARARLTTAMTVLAHVDDWCERLLRDDALAPLHPIVRRERERLGEPLRVAICGPLSAGKSTLVNALTGRSVAVTGRAETTEANWWFRAGPAEAISVRRPGGGWAEQPLAAAGPATLGPIDLDAVDAIEVRLNSPFLTGMTVIDTPGLFSPNAERSARADALLKDRTTRAMAHADALIYVTSELPGAARDDERLREFQALFGAVSRAPTNALLVLSKVDRWWTPREPRPPLEIGRELIAAHADELRHRVWDALPLIGVLAAAHAIDDALVADLRALAASPDRALLGLSRSLLLTARSDVGAERRADAPRPARRVRAAARARPRRARPGRARVGRRARGGVRHRPRAPSDRQHAARSLGRAARRRAAHRARADRAGAPGRAGRERRRAAARLDRGATGRSLRRRAARARRPAACRRPRAAAQRRRAQRAAPAVRRRRPGGPARRHCPTASGPPSWRCAGATPGASSRTGARRRSRCGGSARRRGRPTKTCSRRSAVTPNSSADRWVLQVHELANATLKVAHRRGAQPLINEILDLGRAVRGESTVAVIGRRSLGKSRLLTALVGADVTPSKTDVATNTYIQIEHAAGAPRALVCFTDPEREPEEVPLERLAEYAVAGGERTDDVAYIRVLVDAPLLREGIRLIDTPGLGGADRTHDGVTLRVLEDADAVLLVLDAEQPVTEDEREVLRRAREHVAHVVVAANKAEGDHVEQLAFNEAALGERIIPVSAMLAIEAEALNAADPDAAARVREHSGLDALEAGLRAVAAAARRDRYGLLLDRTSAALDELAAPDREQVELARDDADPAERLKEVGAELERLTRMNPASEVNVRINQLRQQTVDSFRAEVPAGVPRDQGPRRPAVGSGDGGNAADHLRGGRKDAVGRRRD